MQEGFNTAPSQANDPDALLEQAEGELTVEQEEELEKVFPEGPKTDEEQLLYSRIVLEFSTNPETVSVDEIVETFNKERSEALSAGGFDGGPHSVDKSGVVTTGDPLERLKDDQ